MLNNVWQGQKKVREMKIYILGEMIRCLDQRFEGKEEEVDLIKAMKILDSQDVGLMLTTWKCRSMIVNHFF